MAQLPQLQGLSPEAIQQLANQMLGQMAPLGLTGPSPAPAMPLAVLPSAAVPSPAVPSHDNSNSSHTVAAKPPAAKPAAKPALKSRAAKGSKKSSKRQQAEDITEEDQSEEISVTRTGHMTILFG